MTRASVISLALLCAAFACGNGRASSESAAGAKPAPRPPASAVTSTATDSVTDIADRNRVMGKASATVWMIEVSDFQCPFCRTWHDSTYPSLKKEYIETGKVRLAYLNFPLNMHANAIPAAQAAMCAALQGKFWEAHDRIFQAQDRWKALSDPRPLLDSLAVAAGADLATQRGCTQSQRMTALIRADMVRSEQAGVESTPMFFIGNHRILGAAPVATFRAVIDSALAGK